MTYFNAFGQGDVDVPLFLAKRYAQRSLRRDLSDRTAARAGRLGSEQGFRPYVQASVVALVQGRGRPRSDGTVPHVGRVERSERGTERDLPRSLGVHARDGVVGLRLQRGIRHRPVHLDDLQHHRGATGAPQDQPHPHLLAAYRGQRQPGLVCFVHKTRCTGRVFLFQIHTSLTKVYRPPTSIYRCRRSIIILLMCANTSRQLPEALQL